MQVQLGKRTEAGCTWRGLRRWSSIEGSELLLDPLLVSHHLSHEGLLLRRWKVEGDAVAAARANLKRAEQEVHLPDPFAHCQTPIGHPSDVNVTPIRYQADTHLTPI